MLQAPKRVGLVLPSVERPTIFRDPPKSVMTRRSEKVDISNTLHLANTADRIDENINWMPRGVDPAAGVQYSNGAGMTPNFSSKTQGYSPYRVAKDGAFRPPMRRQEDELPISRMPRLATHLQTNAGSSDLSARRAPRHLAADDPSSVSSVRENVISSSLTTQLSMPTGYRQQASERYSAVHNDVVSPGDHTVAPAFVRGGSHQVPDAGVPAADRPVADVYVPVHPAAHGPGHGPGHRPGDYRRTLETQKARTHLQTQASPAHRAAASPAERFVSAPPDAPAARAQPRVGITPPSGVQIGQHGGATRTATHRTVPAVSLQTQVSFSSSVAPRPTRTQAQTQAQTHAQVRVPFSGALTHRFVPPAHAAQPSGRPRVRASPPPPSRSPTLTFSAPLRDDGGVAIGASTSRRIQANVTVPRGPSAPHHSTFVPPPPPAGQRMFRPVAQIPATARLPAPMSAVPRGREAATVKERSMLRPDIAVSPSFTHLSGPPLPVGDDISGHGRQQRPQAHVVVPMGSPHYGHVDSGGASGESRASRPSTSLAVPSSSSQIASASASASALTGPATAMRPQAGAFRVASHAPHASHATISAPDRSAFAGMVRDGPDKGALAVARSSTSSIPFSMGEGAERGKANRETRSLDGVSMKVGLDLRGAHQNASSSSSSSASSAAAFVRPAAPAHSMRTSLRSPLSMVSPSSQVEHGARPENFSHVHGQKVDVDGRHRGWDFGARRSPSWSGTHASRQLF